MEMNGLRIDFTEHPEGVHHVVFVAKESPDAVFLVVGHSHEALLRLFFILLDEGFVDIEFLNAVLTGILKLLCTRHAVRLHRLTHFQGRVDTNAVKAPQLFGVHAAHRGSDDEVGVLLVADIVQQGDGLSGMNGDIGGDDVSLRHHLPQAGDGARLTAGGEAVTIQDRLACHQFRVLFNVRIFHTLYTFLPQRY